MDKKLTEVGERYLLTALGYESGESLSPKNEATFQDAIRQLTPETIQDMNLLGGAYDAVIKALEREGFQGVTKFEPSERGLEDALANLPKIAQIIETASIGYLSDKLSPEELSQYESIVTIMNRGMVLSMESAIKAAYKD